MPQLSETDYAEFSRILEELGPEIDNLTEPSRGFAKDMVEKNGLYGERVFVSIKQFDWLKSLHEKNIGNTAHEKSGDDRDPRSDKDMGDGMGTPDRMDDDIPF